MKKLSLFVVAWALLAPVLLTAGGAEETVAPEAGGDAAADAAMAKEGGLPPGQYNLDEYVRQTGASITFSDSPYLAGRGLPPVEERLPKNPLVMETWMEHGRYGGTLTWTEYTIDHGHYLRHLNAVKLLEIAPSASNHRYDYLGATFQPSILETWEQSDDATQFTFRIREGLKWSDGVPVTTDDVRYAFDDVYFNEEITPKLPSWARWGGEPVQVSIVDDYSFSLSFAKSYGLFLGQVSQQPAGRFMRPSHYMKQYHKDYTDMADILPVMQEQGYDAAEWGKFYTSFAVGGTDAANHIPTRFPNAIEAPSLHPWHVIEEPNPGEFILERNPYFFKIDPLGQQLPYIDRAHRVFVNNLEVMNAKVVAGETDVQFQFIRLGDVPLFKSNEEKAGYRTMLLPAWQQQVLVYFPNLTPADPVYAAVSQDKRFRQAISLALDRKEIRRSIFLDFGRIAQVSPPRGVDFWKPHMDTAYVEYDVDAANALLDEMGLEWDARRQFRTLPDGRRLSIPFMYYEVTPTATPGAELFAEFMGPIGIDTQIKQVDGRLWWASDSEARFSNWWNPTMNFTFGPMKFNVAGREWNNWYASGGESGMEPPPEAKRLYELRDILYSTGDADERREVLTEMWENQAENLWVIGVVAEAPGPFIYDVNLGNIGVAEERGYYSVVVGDAAEQWFWKN